MPIPHAILTASLGVPDLVAARAEVFVSERWSIEAGAGVGLLPLTVHAGVRWTALMPEGWEGHHLRVAPGVVAYVFPSVIEEGMAVVDTDLMWVWTTDGTHGVTAGARVGAGVAWGPGSEGLKVEPAIEVVPVQIGVVF